MFSSSRVPAAASRTSVTFKLHTHLVLLPLTDSAGEPFEADTSLLNSPHRVFWFLYDCWTRMKPCSDDGASHTCEGKQPSPDAEACLSSQVKVLLRENLLQLSDAPVQTGALCVSDLHAVFQLVLCMIQYYRFLRKRINNLHLKMFVSGWILFLMFDKRSDSLTNKTLSL